MGVAVGGLILLYATGGYVFATRFWGESSARLEVQRNLQRAVDALSRELRLAGACLPDAGPSDIRPLRGADNGTTDTVTVRANVRCAVAVLRSRAAVGAGILNVDTVANFVPQMPIYLLSADTTTGMYATVTAVNATSRRLTITPRTNATYAVGSTVYGAESQTFAVDASGSVPVLTVAVGTGAPQPLVPGLERLDVRYVLNRVYDPSTCVESADGLCVVEVPTTEAEWRLVRVLRVAVTARSLKPVRVADPDGFVRLTAQLEIKPRNFLR